MSKSSLRAVNQETYMNKQVRVFVKRRCNFGVVLGYCQIRDSHCRCRSLFSSPAQCIVGGSSIINGGLSSSHSGLNTNELSRLE